MAALGGLDLVRSATVQIVPTGTFIDRELGQQANLASAGSGFVINEIGYRRPQQPRRDRCGLHRGLIDGSDEPLNAKVLGVSECSDLAVIDIDGDGYPALS